VTTTSGCIPITADGLAGHSDQLAVGGHTVYVDVPGAYAALPTQRFPVVYFLHGSTGSGADWLGSGSALPTILDRLTATQVLMPMIAVYPDGDAVTPDGNYWGDEAAGDRDESWLVDQLIPAIDARYRTMGARYRGIAGLSAGGFGALNISIHRPGLFSWVASYSGVFTAPADLFGDAAAANSPQLTSPPRSGSRSSSAAARTTPSISPTPNASSPPSRRWAGRLCTPRSSPALTAGRPGRWRPKTASAGWASSGAAPAET
jgi:S-formylglutathione hydrolase FrmB